MPKASAIIHSDDERDDARPPARRGRSTARSSAPTRGRPSGSCAGSGAAPLGTGGGARLASCRPCARPGRLDRLRRGAPRPGHRGRRRRTTGVAVGLARVRRRLPFGASARPARRVVERARLHLVGALAMRLRVLSVVGFEHRCHRDDGLALAETGDPYAGRVPPLGRDLLGSHADDIAAPTRTPRSRRRGTVNAATTPPRAAVIFMPRTPCRLGPGA